MDLARAVEAVGEMLRRTRARVDLMVSRAVIEAVNDGLKTQRLKLVIVAGEQLPNVEHLQPYGLRFTPPAGAEVLALAIGGSREHTVAICAQHPDKAPKGNDDPETGGLYTAAAWRLYIAADGSVCVGAKESSEHLLLGDKLVQLLQSHTHPTSMGPSGPPVEAAQFPDALSVHKVAP